MFKATKLKRLAFFLTFDIAIFAASFYLAYLLRFSGVLPDYFRGGLVAGRVTMVVLKLFFMWLFKKHIHAVRKFWGRSQRFFGFYSLEVVGSFDERANMIIINHQSTKVFCCCCCFCFT